MANIEEKSYKYSNPLKDLIEDTSLLPGAQPSYQLIKNLLAHMPLGDRLIGAAVDMALGKDCILKVDEAPDDEAAKRLSAVWDEMKLSDPLANLAIICRAYGTASIAVIAWRMKTVRCGKGYRKVVEKSKSNEELTDEQLNGEDGWNLCFNVFDPLNTAGSLVLDQNPNSPFFNKPRPSISVQGEKYIKERHFVLFNGNPIYLNWVGGTFSFGPLGKFSRGLYQIQTYLRNLINQQNASRKASLLVWKRETPSTIPTGAMFKTSELRAETLKGAQSGQALVIGEKESIEAVNLTNLMQAVEILQKLGIADLCAVLGEPEQIVSGLSFAQSWSAGTEDAKKVTAHIQEVQRWLNEPYRWLLNFAIKRAWTDEFMRSELNKLKPSEQDEYDIKTLRQEYAESLTHEWPDVFEDSEKENINNQKAKFAILLDTIRILLPFVSKDSNALADTIDFLQRNMDVAEKLFTGKLNLDIEKIRDAPDGTFALQGSGNDKEPPAAVGLPEE